MKRKGKKKTLRRKMQIQKGFDKDAYEKINESIEPKPKVPEDAANKS